MRKKRGSETARIKYIIGMYKLDKNPTKKFTIFTISGMVFVTTIEILIQTLG